MNTCLLWCYAHIFIQETFRLPVEESSEKPKVKHKHADKSKKSDEEDSSDSSVYEDSSDSSSGDSTDNSSAKIKRRKTSKSGHGRTIAFEVAKFPGIIFTFLLHVHFNEHLVYILLTIILLRGPQNTFPEWKQLG